MTDDARHMRQNATRQEGHRWTYAEFARLPSDGNRYEVIAGELYVTPSPRTGHQAALQKLLLRLGGYVEDHGLGWVLPGPVDILLAEGDYLAPDLVFVRRERRGILSDRGVEAAPDLVVEVVSPSTASRDRGVKRERYLLYGVPECWILDPGGGTVEVHRPGRPPRVEKETVAWRPDPSVPALEIPVPELFRGFE